MREWVREGGSERVGEGGSEGVREGGRVLTSSARGSAVS